VTNNGGLVKGLCAAAAVAAIFVLGFGAEAQDAKKAPAKPASACKGLAEAACKGNAACAWIVPKTGKQRPYCRTKSTGKSKAKAK
jgi:hypothetical protein